MTIKEVEAVIEQLRGSGLDDKAISYSFIQMFLHDQIDYNALIALLAVLGYHIDVDINELSREKQKSELLKLLKKG